MTDTALDEPIAADNITKAQFDSALALYPELIEGISDAKSVKSGRGKLDLLQLDILRFDVLPGKYRELRKMGTDAVPLDREDVLKLVEWKLKHGTFRPALMSKCEANTKEEIREITKAAFSTFNNGDGVVQESMKELTALKGIGPATASLLLSIHDPERVIFFSDEAFHWLCQGGRKLPIKYNAKEYVELSGKSKTLFERLEVNAMEVEKVAFVLLRHASVTARIWQTHTSSKMSGETDVIADDEMERSKGKRKSSAPVAEDAGMTNTRPKRSKK